MFHLITKSAARTGAFRKTRFMDLIKSNGLVSYESIGRFIATLPKDRWLPLKTQLTEQGYIHPIEPLLPAFEFFQSVGHIDLRGGPSAALEVMVFTQRKQTKVKTEEIIKQIRHKL